MIYTVLVFIVGTFLVGIGIDFESFSVGLLGFGLALVGYVGMVTSYLDRK